MQENISTARRLKRVTLSLRTVHRLILVIWSLSILLILAALGTWFSGGGGLVSGFHVLFTSLAFVCFSTIGALIAWQRPKNTIGWIFCVVGLGTGITDFSGAYWSYNTLSGHALLPGAALLNWLGNVVWPLNWGLLLVFLPLLFPNGRPLTRRWRIVGWLAALLIVLSMLAGQLELVGPASWAAHWENVASSINLLEIPLTMAALISLVLRFRRAKERERQQIKWLTYGVALAIVLLLSGIIFVQDENSPLVNYLFDLAFLCLPLSVGISILRAQLYDIDRLISRTLLYLVLSGLLVLTYVALVFGIQFIFQGITRDSPVPIVISTLAVAALFQPLRRWLQRVIDRSFYRSKYNAAQVLARYGATLYTEVDLKQVSEGLLGVVQETMEPAYISLWLAAPGERGRNEA